MTEYKQEKKSLETKSKVNSQNAMFDKMNSDLDLIMGGEKPKT